ncbi:MAG: SDR family NAD(P)-dependent oxidoreductase [Ilumatobacteraceae bacterium]
MLDSDKSVQRSALITGAAQGIGLACGERLKKDGLITIGIDINQTELDSVRDRFDAVAVVDITDYSAAQDVVKKYGPIDVLVNSAGIVGPNMPFWNITDEMWLKTIQVNLTGTFNMMRAVSGQMRAKQWGRIVNISSIAGKEGNPNLAAYSASKAAVIGLTKSAAKELAADGVLVNSVAPAVIDTPMNSDTEPSVLEYMLSKIPLGRKGTANEVAALVSWLVSDECSFSTGACYDISGGRATY